MKIITPKISASFTHLPSMVNYLQGNDYFKQKFLERVSALPGRPDQSNAPWSTIAIELDKVLSKEIHFSFYREWRPIIRKTVISHASNKNKINYNTAFNYVSTRSQADWLENFFHESTHLADQVSIFSFSHKRQSDILTAPFIAGTEAKKLFLEIGHLK